MIKFIQKLIILWEKSKFLTLMEMESKYIEQSNTSILTRDLKGMRTRLGALRSDKEPKQADKQEMVELEAKINETEKYWQMIQSSRDKGADLRKQIKMYRADLWKS